jgi:pimeloyl-ACP methyl ester carboxylesterase
MAVYRTTGSRAALARLLDSLLTAPDQQLEDYLAAAFLHHKLDMGIPPLATPEALAGFRRPTLVIAASDDVTAPGAALLARARELFPQATLEMLPNCKHIPPTDDVSRAERCARVARFLLAEDPPRARSTSTSAASTTSTSPASTSPPSTAATGRRR